MRYPICILLFCLIVCATHAQNTAKDSIVNKSLFDTTHKPTLPKQVNLDTLGHNGGTRKIAVIKHITRDSIITVTTDSTGHRDTLALRKKHDPHKATMHSLMIPGWGQFYNREYWKIPLVYAAIGIPIGTYIYNNTWYKRTRDAYNIVINGETQNYNQINPELFYQGQPLDASSLQNYRNEFRRDRDLSLLIILFAWGLNIVDATVFGHLKDFDVSTDLSMQVQPSFDPTFKTANLGFTFNFKKPKHKEIFALR
jgi:hypothetical protein